ncbi:MAG: hypothetical protein AB8B99_05320 [Phormidesmis sp.]
MSLVTVGLTASTLLFQAQAAQAQAAPIDESAFADSVLSYERGTSQNWNGGKGEWEVYDPTSALGKNNWNKEMTHRGSLGPWNKDIGVSLGKNGSLALEFTDNYLTGSGDDASDLWIFEIGSVAEKTFVEISQDGDSWFNIGIADRKDSGQDSGVGIDIDAFLSEEGYDSNTLFSFVRLTDTGTNNDRNFKSGADIDAIAALSSFPKNNTPAEVPEPGLVGGLGLLGYSLLRKKGSLS